MTEPILVLVSSVSGRGKALRKLPEIERRLREAKVEYQMTLLDDLDHARQLCAQAAEKAGTVVLAGGDGLVHAVLPQLAQSRATFGVIPVGSGNDFARSLGISGLKQAIAAIKRGRSEVIDLGKACGVWFACVASLGLDSEVVRIADQTRFIKGPVVYPYAMVRALLRWKNARFNVRFDNDRMYEFEGCNVVVANTAFYGGGMKVAPQADPTDGRFQIVVIEKVSKPYFLWQSRKVFAGTHVKIPEITVFSAQKVRVGSSRVFDVFADGERVGCTPAEIEVVPAALRVLR